MNDTDPTVPDIPIPLRDAALNGIQRWSYNNFGTVEPEERAARVAETLNVILVFMSRFAAGTAPERRATMVRLLTTCLVPKTTATEIAEVFFPTTH